ncbi:hypothetical protein EDB81DRAFT_906816 [Dactylonectria macrodidyma]|uniref:F-box domain-containing protein n=1 Tax=Dactylonectria macrodidyma TaxID=307937 RepID=A0A9P9E1H5_9HYPO|nr:hypothetical protein EDB81DRAFT_906816 [Dactylonectria macrodidyma]
MAATTSSRDALALRTPTLYPTSRTRLRSKQQTRITDFFPSTSPPKPTPRISFLDLPKSVRDKIYDESNVGGDKFINLNCWVVSSPDQWWEDDDQQPNNTSTASSLSLCFHTAEASPGVIEEPFPAALLWAGSRLIHDEVEAKLYAQNTFAVDLVMRGGLRPLEMLSDAALSHLRALVVSLRRCSCLTPFCDKERCLGNECDDCHLWPRPLCCHFWETVELVGGDRQHAKAMSTLSRTDKQALERWKRICARLVSNVTPGQLKFYLVAKVADLETAHAILDPLDDMPLSSLARSAALRLMNKLQYPPFRFTDLPPELQIRILEFTSLTAYRYVTWNAEQKFRIGVYKRLRDTDDDPYDYPALCDCMDDGFSLNDEYFCMSWKRTAFSTRCRCHERPINYFLVSKAFSAAARSVFYARNEFRLLPFSRSWKEQREMCWFSGGDDGIYALPLASFMDYVPRDFMSNFTHITLVFPPLAPISIWSEPSSPGGYYDWTQAINDLAQRVHLPRLKFEVHFADHDPLRMEVAQTTEPFTDWLVRARSRPDDVAEMEMWKTYKRVLRPLKRLGPQLRALLIYAPWPICPLEGEDPFAFEEELEQEIMGQEYDSWEWGKQDASPYTHPRCGTL